MKNKILTKIGLLALILCLTLTLSGCGLKKDSNQVDSNGGSSSEKANDSKTNDMIVFDYMEKLSPENTVEEMNAIIGSEGELVDEKYNKYSWNISEDTTLTATYYSSKTATIKIDIDKNLLKNDKVDLSCAKDLKSEINSTNGLKYDDFVSRIGSEGYVVEKSSSSITYKWVNSQGGYLSGSFSKSSGKCTFFSAFA